MDIRTLLFIVGIINVFLFLFSFGVKRTVKVFPGIEQWMVANLLIAVGYFLLYLRDVVPDFYSIVLAHMLFFFAGSIRLWGIHSFFSKKMQKKEIFLLAVGFISLLFILLYFTFIRPNILIRGVSVGLSLAILSIYTGIVVLKNRIKTAPFFFYLSSGFFFFFAFILIMRFSIWFIYPSIRELLNPNFLNAFQFFAGMVIDILWTMLFFFFNQEKINASLKENENKFRNLVENVQSAVYRSTLEYPWFFEYVTLPILEITGYHPDEIIKRKITYGEIIHPEDCQKVIEVVQNAVLEKKVYEIEYRIIKKNGEIAWVLERGKAYYDSLGNPLFLDGILVPITERKKIEFSLQEAKQRAEYATEAKSIFLANMSHEIRTPLNAIINIAHFLSETEQNSIQKEYTQTLLKSSEILLVLINDILDFSKIEAGKLEIENIDFKLEEVIHSVYQILKIKSNEKALGFEIVYENPIQHLLVGDPIRLKQVLINILNNSIKFTEKGGVKLLISTIQEDANTIELQFKINDTGIGIEQSKMNHLFTPFYQIDSSFTRKYGGTGLGLTISKQLIEQMGGSIVMESEINKGTTVTFRIPFKKQYLEKQDKKTEVLEGENRKKNIRILVAEDNVINQKVMDIMLKKMNIAVDYAHDGKEAVELFFSNHYDLILMDIEMPEMDGLEATRRIRESDSPNKNIPIIALSAHVLKEYQDKFLQAGMNDFVPKPIDINVLEKTMAKVLDTIH